MALKTCGNSECNPVEQTRGDMGEGDYVDVIKAHEFVGPGPGSNVHRDTAVRLHEMAEMHDGIRNDFRICCLTCGKATGWNQRDLPNMPEAGADYVRKQWDKKQPDKSVPKE